MNQENTIPQQMPTQAEKLMTVEELAEFLNVSKFTVNRWAQRGVIPSIKIGGALRFSRQDVLSCNKTLSEKP